MRCPYCKADNDRVIDSRASADGFAIRRRRTCRDCGRRYTTYERVEGAPLRVVKKSGERAEFDRQKILAGLLKACEKRPVSAEQLERIVESVERQCMEAFDKEVPSKVIGELIMQQLQHLDQVAYVRFASVYREFKDVTQFLEELKPMLEKSGVQRNNNRDEKRDERGMSETASRVSREEA
jgi:transcriptional repressor NrdR